MVGRKVDAHEPRTAPAALDALIGLRVVAVEGAAHDVLVFENGARVQRARPQQ